MRAGSRPIAQLSCELGIRSNRLYKRRKAVQTHGEKQPFPGSGRRSLEHTKPVWLRRALERAEEKLEILQTAELYGTSAPTRNTPRAERCERPTR